VEPRKDALYDVEIKGPAGTLVSLKGADFDTAFAACKAIQDSTRDEKLLNDLNVCMRSFGFCGTSGRGYSVRISARMPRSETGEKQTCPRRLADIGPWERSRDLDTWHLVGKDKICSFCGSLHPDRVIELIKQHGFKIVDRSTKSYKMYINQPNVPNASFGGIKYYRYHDTEKFIDDWNSLITLATAGQTAQAT